MNRAQRRIVTRTLFCVAALCVLLLLGGVALFAVASQGIGEGIAIVLFFGWPVALIGIGAWLVGLYVRAGGQRDVENPPGSAPTNGNSKVDPASADPMTVAGVAALMWAQKERPFSDHENLDVEIPAEHQALFLASFWCYQFFIYVKLIEEKFGAEIASLVEQCLRITLNRLPDKLGDEVAKFFGLVRQASESHAEGPQTMPGRPDIPIPLEWPLALGVLALVPDSPFYVPPTERGNPPPMPDLHGLDLKLATCLEHARISALEVFTPMIAHIGLNPETVAGFKVGPQVVAADPQERERNAAVEKAIAAIDDVKNKMRAEAARLGLQPEDMVLTREGIRPAEGKSPRLP
jgi:hypothetical protein